MEYKDSRIPAFVGVTISWDGLFTLILNSYLASPFVEALCYL